MTTGDRGAGRLRLWHRVLLWTPSAVLLALWLNSNPEMDPGDIVRTSTAARAAGFTTSSPSPAPSLRDPAEYDHELVAVLVTATFCFAARRDDFRENLPDLGQALQERAQAEGATLRRVGVSIDWDPMEGATFLAELWDFDEIVAGGNWVNGGTLKYIWETHPGEPAIPQLILLRRRLGVTPTGGYTLDEEEITARIVGVDEILRWTAQRRP